MLRQLIDWILGPAARVAPAGSERDVTLMERARIPGPRPKLGLDRLLACCRAGRSKWKTREKPKKRPQHWDIS